MALLDESRCMAQETRSALWRVGDQGLATRPRQNHARYPSLPCRLLLHQEGTDARSHTHHQPMRGMSSISSLPLLGRVWEGTLPDPGADTPGIIVDADQPHNHFPKGGIL